MSYRALLAALSRAILIAAAVALGAEPSVALAARSRHFAALGERPPAFVARDLSEREQTLAQYEGSVLVLHFWATWCPYCRGEIPELLELHERWGTRGVRVLTVSLDEDVGHLKRFVAQRALSYPVIAEAQQEGPSLAARYRIVGIPVTYVIGRDGRILARLEGSADLLGAVRRALEDAERAT